VWRRRRETNKLVGYLAATSRKLGKPLAIGYSGRHGAGKSSLIGSVLSFHPPEVQSATSR